MRIAIYDLDSSGVLSVDLRKVLRALNKIVLHANWSVNRVYYQGEKFEVVGTVAKELEQLALSKERILTSELEKISRTKHQLIWAEFRAYETPNEGTPFLLIRAVDSSWFEILSEDPAVISSINTTFSNTKILT